MTEQAARPRSRWRSLAFTLAQMVPLIVLGNQSAVMAQQHDWWRFSFVVLAGLCLAGVFISGHFWMRWR